MPNIFLYIPQIARIWLGHGHGAAGAEDLDPPLPSAARDVTSGW